MRHGGDLAAAEAAFGTPAQGWLDLSTGVNPRAYPVRPFSPAASERLPDPADLGALCAIARGAYGWRPGTLVVAGAGAQAMIQLLPHLRPRGSVAVLGPTYAEHAVCWARAGHEVRNAASLAEAADADVVIVVNPDNPTGKTTKPDALARLAFDLARNEGLLIVDESFADVAPEIALSESLASAGVVVLRSFGKFYGLPGLRLGFAAGDRTLLASLKRELGPWPVCGPAIEAARVALRDHAWADATRARLYADAARLDGILTGAGFTDIRGCALFRTARHRAAARIHENLARQGVWCRRFDERPDELRFGLPGEDAGFVRVRRALENALEAAA